MACECGLEGTTKTCCLPIIKGEKDAPTAEALMRARYTAYVEHEIDFLIGSLHPEHEHNVDRESTKQWAESAAWMGLDVLNVKDGSENDETGEVEFIAHFQIKEQDQAHHERATFAKHKGKWFFVDGQELQGQPVVRDTPRIGRNEPCTCGSGKKYKKCCGKAA